jgi:transcriptional regulator with XRE-family HTH domain
MNSNSNNRLWKKLQKPRYRDAFIAANVGVQIAAQLNALRTSRGKSQEKLADEIGMNQSTISQMEKPEYRTYSVSTLIRFAQYYKVALDVRFVSLVDHIKRLANQTPESLAPEPFDDFKVSLDEPRAPRAQMASVDQETLPLKKLVPKGRRQKSQEDELSDLLILAKESNLIDEEQIAEA